MSQTDYDVLIVGAGMVGATLACGLAQRGLQVAVVDASEPLMTWDTHSYDMRVSAITRASQQLFDRVGAWDRIAAQRISPYQDMVVWDAGSDGAIHFDSADMGEADLGHIIENRVMVKALHQRMAELDNITLYCPQKLQHMQVEEKQASVTLADNTVLHAQLLVGADGSRSWLRQQADIAVKGWDFDQAALVTTVKTEQHHQNTAWQRFLPTGPLAFLPLPDGFSSIVWSTQPDEAQRLCALPEDAFACELADAFEHRLGAIESVAARAVFPLRLFETLHYVKPRLALVGDAAHTIHPLAGQGVNLGLGDVARLLAVIAEAQQAGQDFADNAVLRRYERRSRADNRSMLLAMDGLKRLFGSELDVVRQVRGLGLSVLDRLTPIKNQIMKQAMGL